MIAISYHVTNYSATLQFSKLLTYMHTHKNTKLTEQSGSIIQPHTHWDMNPDLTWTLSN